MRLALENKVKGIENLELLTGDEEYEVKEDNDRVNSAKPEAYFNIAKEFLENSKNV